jgi:diguanylate cyclase (GGDEF)-like protein
VDRSEPVPEICCAYRTRYERERSARLAAESIAEQGLRELYQKKQLLELVGSIAIAANQSSSVEETFEFALASICETIGWQVGHVYMKATRPRAAEVKAAGTKAEGAKSEEEAAYLQSTAIWYGAGEESLAEFRAETEGLSFPAGEGLPGRVLVSGYPAWIAELREDGNFPRRATALGSGLRAAFAFPVLAGTEVVAVLEFFANFGADPDEFFLQLMAQIGAQLGRVVERKRTEEQLVREAFHDPLTSLPNRALLFERLAQAIARHKRHPESKFALLFIDLDRFKIVNDSLGHRAGDTLIVQAAARFARTLRETDVFARCSDPRLCEQGILARFGGDEFVVLLEDLRHTIEAAKVAARLQQTLDAPFFIGDSQLFMTASIGIASSDTGYDTPGDVLRDADLAMYRAKAAGKAQYRVFDTRMHTQAMSRLELESSLRLALERQEFLLHYQPIVNAATGNLHGFEALLRWARPGFGLAAPGAFIEVAEDTGLIVPLGLWVLGQACTTLRQWQLQFPEHAGLNMSVNLSPKQFAQPMLTEDVRTILAQTGVNPAQVRLEVTESCTIDDADRAHAILSQFRALGVELSIDDFGTGFSSLSHLHRFPFQHLKVDRSFISRIGTDGEGLAIVRTIVRLARDLRLQVTAEGVETALQAERLQHLNCDYAQGYFYAKPLAPGNAEDVLRYGLRSPANFTLVED